jgi:hypothetical protein
LAFSRRRFLQNGVLAAITCAATEGWSAVLRKGPPASINPAPPPTPVGGADVVRQQFTDAIGSSFQVNYGGAAPTFVRLLAVTDFAAAAAISPASFAVMPPVSNAPAVVTSAYLLSFAGTSTEQLPQGTHIFDHQQLGQFSLFVVPGAGAQQSCSAVINHLQNLPSALPIVNSVAGGQGNFGTAGVGSLRPVTGGFSAPAARTAEPAGSSPAAAWPGTETTRPVSGGGFDRNMN